MKTTLSALLIGLCAVGLAQTKDSKEITLDKHTKAAIVDHQKMAKAHSDAAQCLASGKEEKSCHAQLTASCPDVGIGKYCGMKHKH